MYLSPQVSDDEGTYFSYPVSPAIRQTNLRTCLPGGFSGSGPEYSMYRSNCLDLMAEECHSKWGPECDAYRSELSKGEQEVFAQLIDRRNAPAATSASCHSMRNPIVPGQTVRYGMVASIQGTDCKDDIVMPQSCAYSRPESVIEDSSQEDRERQEDLLRERHGVYEQQQARRKKEHFQSEFIHHQMAETEEARREVYEQQQARRKKEHFHSEFIEHQMNETEDARREVYEQQQARRKKEHFQSEFIQQQMYHNEQARRKEHFQSEMIQRGLYESRPMREKFQSQFMAQSASVPVRSAPPQPFTPSQAPPQPEPVPHPFMPSQAPPQPEPIPQPFMPSQAPPQPEPIPQPFMPSQAPPQPEPIPQPFMPSQAPPQPEPFMPPQPEPFTPSQAVSIPVHAQEPHVPPHAVSIPVQLSESQEAKPEPTPAYVFGVPTDCEQQACSVSSLLE
jgi:hypothetical protein